MDQLTFTSWRKTSAFRRLLLLAFIFAYVGAEAAQDVLFPFVRDGKWGYIDSRGRWAIPPQYERCFGLFDGSFAWANQGGKWGCIDRSGQWIVDPQFSHPSPFFGAPAVVVTKGRSVGLLDLTGKIILAPVYKEIYPMESSAWVLRDGKLGVFGFDGQWIRKPEIEWPRGRALPIVANSKVSWFRTRDNWGLLANDGKILFKPQFLSREPGPRDSEDQNHPAGLDFKNGRAWVTKGSEHLLINDDGKVVTRLNCDSVREWNDTLYVFRSRDGQEGLISRDGEIVLPATYSRIGGLREEMAILEQREDLKRSDGKTVSNWTFGCLDSQGRIVVPPGVYRGLNDFSRDDTVLPAFSQGLAPVWNNSKAASARNVYDPFAGYIDRSGTLVIPQQFLRTTPFSEGMAAVLTRKESGPGLSPDVGSWGYIDKAGKIVIEPKFNGATPFVRDRAWVVKPGGRWDECDWAMIDRAGNVLTEFAYYPPEQKTGWLYAPSERLERSRWRGNLAILTKGDFANGLATPDGKTIIEPIWNRIGTFHHGVAVSADSRSRDQSGNVKFVHALLTENGEVLVRGEFTEISDFKDGVAWATRRWTDRQGPYKDSGWGIIDTRGQKRSELIYVRPSWAFFETDDYSSPERPAFSGELAAVALAENYHPYGDQPWLTNSWGYIDRFGHVIAWWSGSEN